MKWILTLMGILILGWQELRAESLETHALMTREEQELQVKTKKRLYPGGKDEEPLKVQAQLPSVTRKMGPAVEAPEEEAAEGSETD